jgi:hypothetical protein
MPIFLGLDTSKKNFGSGGLFVIKKENGTNRSVNVSKDEKTIKNAVDHCTKKA